MKTIQKKIQGTVVVMVKYRNNLWVAPHHNDYGHEGILNTTPCRQVGNKYFDLRTGKEIVMSDNMVAWSVLPGTAFRYPDGEHLFITRYFDQSLGLMSMEPAEFNRESMTMIDLIDRQVKEAA